jgi:aliphatic nitrilase
MEGISNSEKTIRLAAVQAAPEFLDRGAGVEKACRLIREAGQEGAQIIGFPEGFIPTHPLWYHFHPDSSKEAFEFAKRLFENSVAIPSPATEALCRSAGDAGIFVVMGLCEREPPRIGTMYNTLLFINGQGEIVGRHRKLVPTLGERLVHTPGDALGLKAYPTAFGRVSGLMCGENSNSLADFVLNAQGTNIHVASWPSHFNVGRDMRETIMLATRALAYRLKAFVINAIGEVSDTMRRELPVTDEHRAFLEQQGGGASILGPRGQVIAGPMEPGEGILYADVSLDATVVPKLIHDFGGHYNRFDIFQLRVASGLRPNLSTWSSSENVEVEKEPSEIVKDSQESGEG